MSVADFNYFLALGTVALQLVTIGLLAAFVLRARIPAFADVIATVASHGLWIAFVLTFLSTALTVYYSDALGFEPCYWCYWQRIFLFPQVVLLGMAAWKKDAYMADYSIVLSVLGALTALYHHALQMLPGSGLPCPAVGVSCAQRIFFEFGYITFPLMAFSVFALLIALMLAARMRRT